MNQIPSPEHPGRTWSSPSAQQLVLGEANSLLSFWPHVRGDQALSASVALDVLATWAHLRRFSRESLTGDCAARLDGMVRQEADSLVAQFLRSTFPASWRARAEELDQCWERTVDNIDADELGQTVHDLFDLLDRHALATYAGEVLLPVESPWRRQLADAAGALEQADQFLADQPDIFLPAALLTEDMSVAYRADLQEFDEALWRTTLKYRILEELLEEQRTGPSLPKLGQGDWQELLAHKKGRAGNMVVAPPWQDHHSQCKAAERSYAMAAAGRPDLRTLQSHHSLAAKQFPVAGAEHLRATFDWWRPAEKERLQWRIYLAGSDELIERFTKVVIELPSAATPLEAPLGPGGLARLDIDEGAAEALTSPGVCVMLIDRAGAAYRVRLEDSIP